MVGLVFFLTVFLAFTFCSFRTGSILCFVTAVIDSFVLPFLTSIVGITFTIIVDNKVILVEATSHDLFVAVLVDLVVDGT